MRYCRKISVKPKQPASYICLLKCRSSLVYISFRSFRFFYSSREARAENRVELLADNCLLSSETLYTRVCTYALTRFFYMYSPEPKGNITIVCFVSCFGGCVCDCLVRVFVVVWRVFWWLFGGCFWWLFGGCVWWLFSEWLGVSPKRHPFNIRSRWEDSKPWWQILVW